MNDTPSVRKILLLALIHTSVLILALLILYQSDLIPQLPHHLNVLGWDANWYQDIRSHGYQFLPDQQSNAGFYPGFPYLWKFSGLGSTGICILNSLLFLFSAMLLAKEFRLTSIQFLIALSFPASFFFFLPYTESLFFFSGTVLLIGWIRKNMMLFLAGVFLASITRATGTFFLPAFLVILLVCNKDQRRFAWVGMGTSIAGLFAVTLIQYFQTGIWFVYFKAQAQFWERSFHWPKDIFTTWGGERMIWADGIALFIGLGSLALFARYSVRKILLHKNDFLPPIVLFSLAYLSMVAMSIIFFNPKPADGTTTLFGIFRYTFAAPFLWVVFAHYSVSVKPRVREVLLLIIITWAFWLSFGSYRHIQQFLYWTVISAYLLLHILPRYYPSLRHGWILVYLANLVAQVWLYGSFLEGLWVG